MEQFTALAPKTASELIRAGLAAYLARQRTPTPKNQTTSEDEKPAINKQPRLLAFFAASAAFGEGAEPTLCEHLLAELLVLAHHPEICESLKVYSRSKEVIMVFQVETLDKFGLSYARRHI